MYINWLYGDVLDTIYKYKHQIEMCNFLKKLIQHKIHCGFNVPIGICIQAYGLLLQSKNNLENNDDRTS